jgi:hypothetical protein
MAVASTSKKQNVPSVLPAKKATKKQKVILVMTLQIKENKDEKKPAAKQVLTLQ